MPGTRSSRDYSRLARAPRKLRIASVAVQGKCIKAELNRQDRQVSLSIALAIFVLWRFNLLFHASSPDEPNLMPLPCVSSPYT